MTEEETKIAEAEAKKKLEEGVTPEVVTEEVPAEEVVA